MLHAVKRAKAEINITVSLYVDLRNVHDRYDLFHFGLIRYTVHCSCCTLALPADFAHSVTTVLDASYIRVCGVHRAL